MIIDNDHERVGRWMQEKGAGFWRPETKCIGLEREGKIVAGTMYDWFNGASIYAHIAIDGRINREFLWFIFYYPFVQLNANVIICLIAEDNKKSQNLAEHFGFRLTARIPHAHTSGCQLIYIMYRDQCQWLRIKHEQIIAASRS